MQDYVTKALPQFKHTKPQQFHYGPSNMDPIQYGAKVQLTQPDTSPALSAQRIRHIQDVVGSFAWCGRATDLTMLATLSSIASRQSKGTEQLEEEVKQFLDYCATHPNAGVRFVTSDMLLTVHSDASYLSEPGSKSQAAGHHYLSKLMMNISTTVQS